MEGVFNSPRESSGEDYDAFVPGNKIGDLNGALLKRIRKSGSIPVHSDAVKKDVDDPIEVSYISEGIEKTAELMPLKKPEVEEEIRATEERKKIERTLDEINIFLQRVVALEDQVRMNEQLNYAKFLNLGADFTELRRDVLASIKALNSKELQDTTIKISFNSLIDQMEILRKHIADGAGKTEDEIWD